MKTFTEMLSGMDQQIWKMMKRKHYAGVLDHTAVPHLERLRREILNTAAKIEGTEKPRERNEVYTQEMPQDRPAQAKGEKTEGIKFL